METRAATLGASDRTANRPRIALVAVIAGLAFAVGVALMVMAVRENGGWTIRRASPAPTPSVVAPPEAVSLPRSPVEPVMSEQQLLPLAERQVALAAQLATLEARASLVATDLAASGDRAARAESLLVLAATRRALDRGDRLGYLDGELRRRFGPLDTRAVQAILRFADDPVTLEDLREGLEANARRLSYGGGGWWDGVEREIGNLVIIRRAGTPSPLPADRLARARRALATGQVDAALAEVQRLPGARETGAWIDAARRYIVARRGLRALESVAILGPAGTVPPVRVSPLPSAPEPVE